jgi:hypothetical protein
MTKIINLVLYRLTNDEHFQAIYAIRSLIILVGAALLKIEKQFAVFAAAFDKEDDAFKKIVKNTLTEDIQVLDHARDDLFRGMADAVKSALRHFNAKVVASARRLQNVLDTYGNVAIKAMNQETSAIYNMLQEFKGAYAEDVATVCIGDWVIELEKANLAFDALITARDDESAAKSTLVMKECRAKVDAAYRDIVTRVEAFAVVDENPAIFEDFIHRLNIIIKRYNDAVAQRAGKAKAKKTNDDK